MDFSELYVLVVEDHDFQRRLALQMLKGLGVVELREACDGKQALEVLRAMPGKPDIVISDLDMPGMDGIEFLRHVAEQKLAGAVAIASSLDDAMLSTVETMARAYGLQVLGAVGKPMTARRLTQLLGLYQRRADLGRRPASSHGEADADTLRTALDAGAFVPHFQPKIDLRTGKAKGVEALARWQRADGDVMAAGRFMPAIEREGLVDRLTESMLEQACVAQKAWEKKSLVQFISINVSMLSLDDVGVADRYLAIVRGLGVDVRLVTFEVTESSVMKDPAKALNILARLRLKGFGLSIDDFGTGYSSLQQLGAIPFTELKVDQTFVRGAVGDARKRTMVETSLELARKLKLRTVGEGAETREEWDLLIELGCDELQGWFVAPAMPAADIPGWMRGWKPPAA